MVGLMFEDMKEMLSNEVIEKNMAIKKCFLLEQEVAKMKKMIEDMSEEKERLVAQINAKEGANTIELRKK